MAVVVQNKFVKHITEVVPWTDRIISITLQAAMPLTFISAYAVPAKSIDKTRAESAKLRTEKDSFY